MNVSRTQDARAAFRQMGAMTMAWKQPGGAIVPLGVPVSTAVAAIPPAALTAAAQAVAPGMSTGEKVAIAGGVLVVLAGGAYLLFFRGGKRRNPRRRRRAKR